MPLEILRIKNSPEFLFLLFLPIEPSSSALPWLRPVAWQLDNFELLELFAHSLMCDREGSVVAGRDESRCTCNERASQ